MAQKSSKKITLSFSVNQLLVFLLIFGVIGTIALVQSYAAPRSKNKLSIPDGVYGGTVTAVLSGASTLSDPWVIAECYQNSSPVIFNRLALDDAGQATLTLGPSVGWQSGIGGADCEAEARNWNLKRQRWDVLTTTTFHVSD